MSVARVLCDSTFSSPHRRDRPRRPEKLESTSLTNLPSDALSEFSIRLLPDYTERPGNFAAASKVPRRNRCSQRACSLYYVHGDIIRMRCNRGISDISVMAFVEPAGIFEPLRVIEAMQMFGELDSHRLAVQGNRWNSRFARRFSGRFNREFLGGILVGALIR